MTSVFRLHPDDLEKKMNFIGLNIFNNNSLDFLKDIEDKYNINVSIYYRIIKSIEEYKLKNIFYFMNLRFKKVNLKIEYEDVNNNKINDIFNNFIKNNIVKSIIIMNLIQQYIYPLS